MPNYDISRREFFKTAAFLVGDAILAENAEAQQEIMSSAEILRRFNDYSAKVNKENPDGIEISNDKMAPENIIASVVMSEEMRDWGSFHLGVLIAWTILNRAGYYKGMDEQELKNKIEKVVKGDKKDFGSQEEGRPYASDIDAIASKTAPKYRAFARMILQGLFDEYNFGQTHFFHVKAQEKFHRLYPKKYKSPETVVAERLSIGLKEIKIPGISSDYVRFFGPK